MSTVLDYDNESSSDDLKSFAPLGMAIAVLSVLIVLTGYTALQFIPGDRLVFEARYGGSAQNPEAPALDNSEAEAVAAELQSLRKERLNYVQRIEELQSENASYTAFIVQLREDSTQLRQKVAFQESQLQKVSEEEPRQVTSPSVLLTRRVESLERQLSDREKYITSMQSTLSAKNYQLQDLETAKKTAERRAAECQRQEVGRLPLDTITTSKVVVVCPPVSSVSPQWCPIVE